MRKFWEDSEGNKTYPTKLSMVGLACILSPKKKKKKQINWKFSCMFASAYETSQ